MKEKTLKTLEYYKIISLLEDKAESSLGKSLVRDLKPYKEVSLIEGLQAETQEAYEIIMARGNPPLFGIKDLREYLKRVEIGGSLSPKGLLMVSDSLRVTRALKDYIKKDRGDREGSYPIIEERISSLVSLKYLEDEINKAIISEEEISDNASPRLQSIRRQIRQKNDSIRSKLNSIIGSDTYKKHLQDNIITMREGRYVVPVRQESKSFVKGLVHDISSSGATVFVEPMAVVELNNQLKELEVSEREEIERILKELSLLVKENSDLIRLNQEALKNLDFIFAKGKLAIDQNAIRPKLNTRGYTNLKAAKHPLLKVEKIVPIDIYIGDEFNSLIITGPNTGGKTVSLKTLGLLTLMAQSGLHIPCHQESEVGVFNKVFADIGDEQSIEQSLSTFSSHMTNIVSILEDLEENSLVLFDELGAGTDPTEGAALAMAILDNLLNRKIRTVATTHYSQLKAYALTRENVKNASVEFDIETLSPTYRLLIGVPGKSNAFEISKRLGLQDYIIDEAKKLISRENIDLEDLLQALEKDRLEAEENRAKSERYKDEALDLRRELEEERNKTKAMRDKILEKAKEEARLIYKSAKEEADFIVKDLREISAEIEKDRNKKIQESQEKLRGKLKDLEADIADNVLNVRSNKPPKNLKVGESVRVLSFNQIGTVVTEPDNNGDLIVQVGIMKINTNLKSLKRESGEEVEKIKSKTKKIIKNKSKSIKTEVDLRGMNLDDAFLEVDKYLDDAYIAGLKEVQIIHGKGTGVLREGIGSYLRGHRLVKSFRLGDISEGGDGVTVASLK